MKVTDLGLSTRVERILSAEGVHDTEGLCALTPVDLFKMPNLGRGSFDAINDALRNHGLRLTLCAESKDTVTTAQHAISRAEASLEEALHALMRARRVLEALEREQQETET